jgi:hypothetical protein
MNEKKVKWASQVEKILPPHLKASEKKSISRSLDDGDEVSDVSFLPVAVKSRPADSSSSVDNKKMVDVIYDQIERTLIDLKTAIKRQLDEIRIIECEVLNIKKTKSNREPLLILTSNLLSKTNIMKVYIKVIDNINDNALNEILEHPEDVSLAETMQLSINDISQGIDKEIEQTMLFMKSIER